MGFRQLYSLEKIYNLLLNFCIQLPVLGLMFTLGFVCVNGFHPQMFIVTMHLLSKCTINLCPSSYCANHLNTHLITQ